MVLAKASLKFKSKNASDKVSYGQNVVDQLVANDGPEMKTPFPDLPYTTDQLQVIVDTLRTAAGNIKQGGKIASAALKDAVTKWNDRFTATANYVSLVAKGSELLIAMAGFDSTKTNKSKKPLPGGIKNFSARVNHSKGAVTIGAKLASDFAGRLPVCSRT